jgi:hypothetical protein
LVVLAEEPGSVWDAKEGHRPSKLENPEGWSGLEAYSQPRTSGRSVRPGSTGQALVQSGLARPTFDAVQAPWGREFGEGVWTPFFSVE